MDSVSGLYTWVRSTVSETASATSINKIKAVDMRTIVIITGKREIDIYTAGGYIYH